MPSCFVPDPWSPRRRITREVRVGEVGIGGTNPIRIQSMTTTDTKNTRATCDQAERLTDAGCEIVRLTAPSITDAENLADIRRELDRRGVRVPLVADIHFTPNAALIAAEHVEKVRINPGNYADKKKFAVREYSDAEYRAELDRVAARFQPLVRRCRELGRAMRIGTNHGSLSDRIMNRYGDTPLGMVESALEFLAVCEGEAFYDVVFSMKSSNPQVAIQAYRLLAARLLEQTGEAPGYPFHLGVTEAGDGEDARVKSAIGIGSLLEDGIGDTVRVSLTEDPVRELPAARALAARYDRRWREPPTRLGRPAASFVGDPYTHTRRASVALSVGGIAIGGREPVRAELELGPAPEDPAALARSLAASLARCPDLACEGLLVEAWDPAALARASAFRERLRSAGVTAPLAVRAPGELAEGALKLAARWVLPLEGGTPDPLLKQSAQAAARAQVPLEWNLRVAPEQIHALLDRAIDAAQGVGLDSWLVSVETSAPVHGARILAARLAARDVPAPIVLRQRRPTGLEDEAALIHTATDLGAPLCDGIGDSIALAGFGPPERALPLAYRVLQGARLRTSWTEFISCPSCGRTLFDLEETTARIKARTAHLAGVKIAIMGCIVNGPGEMADADFGYVGSGPGRVNLYVGKECVVRNVPQERADDRLVELIREQGRWVDA